MKIKAISLWQPWASLIAWGGKKYETRSWATNYRGPLLICASRKPFNPLVYEGAFLNTLSTFWGSINHRFPSRLYILGCAVAIVELTNCSPAAVVAQILEPRSYEMAFGDFTPGRWAWTLDNIRRIEPFPVKGRQGLFEVELPEGLIL